VDTETGFYLDNIYINKSKISGKGVFSKHEIKANTEIQSLTRPLVRLSEIPKKGESGYGHSIQLQKNWWLLMDNTQFYYINHHCNPNVKIDLQVTSSKIKSIRDISSNEELTLDYSKIIYEDDEFVINCNCGYENCQKIISGKRK
tara:strand:- start:79 stop:513 length:435 start_codon:yes stop_codon:yes gene_type:complete